MTTRRIRLVRYEAARVNFTYLSAYRMRVEVVEVEGEDIDPYIFIYKKGVVNPYSNSACTDEFQAVIGPSQYATIPAGEPDPNKSWPYYRLNYFEVDFMSEAQAMRVWEVVKREVCILVEAMGKLTQLEQVEEAWCPDEPGDESTESESVSESVSESA